MSHPKIILIGGPTASGKSALALKLAREYDGTIINADAMQIYKGLPILSAQPSRQEQETVPHELYGTLDPSEKSSAGVWLALASEAIDRTIAAGRTPILTGGTGLYFSALLGGLAEIPPIPFEVREQVEKLYDEQGEETFRQNLAKQDSESAARLEKNDRQRLIRAYEVATHTGKPLSEWHKQTTKPKIQNPEFHLVMPEREKLYAACNNRFSHMIEQGALEEARTFLDRNLDPSLPAMKTLGLREIAAYLKGEITLNEATEKAQQATRNYAKRQMTWFRNQWKNTTPIHAP